MPRHLEAMVPDVLAGDPTALAVFLAEGRKLAVCAPVDPDGAQGLGFAAVIEFAGFRASQG